MFLRLVRYFRFVLVVLFALIFFRLMAGRLLYSTCFIDCSAKYLGSVDVLILLHAPVVLWAHRIKLFSTVPVFSRRSLVI